MRLGILILAILALVAISVILVNQKFMGNYLKTSDGLNIAYKLYKVKNPKGWLILTHMMPATKESWNDFAEVMQKDGYESLAIDFRGHGESDGGPNGYQRFGDEEHQASINDLEAGWKLLESRSASRGKTYLVGASIGANLSLQFLAKNSEFKKGVLLSAGLNYRGIETRPLVQNLNAGQSVLFVTGKDDDNNAEENQILYDLIPKAAKGEILIYEQGGHGTNLFKSKGGPDLIGAVKQFLEN